MWHDVIIWKWSEFTSKLIRATEIIFMVPKFIFQKSWKSHKSPKSVCSRNSIMRPHMFWPQRVIKTNRSSMPVHMVPGLLFVQTREQRQLKYFCVGRERDYWNSFMWTHYTISMLSHIADTSHFYAHFDTKRRECVDFWRICDIWCHDVKHIRIQY